jgi:regulator of sigma E protease
MNIVWLVLGVLMFIGLVLVHEWGHFFAARKNGVEVEEFGLGFPPRAKILTKKKGTIYSLNWLPLGGFVKLQGEHDSDNAKGDYGAATLKGKILIMMAGVAMNLLTAVFLFLILALAGMPQMFEGQFQVKSDSKLVQEAPGKDIVLVGSVVDGMPAARAGIKEDMEIVSVAGVIIDTPDQVIEVAKANKGTKVIVKTTDQSFDVQLSDNTDGKGYLGISPKSGQTGVEIRRSTWSSPVVAVGLTTQITKLTFEGFGRMISSIFRGNISSAGRQVTGTVGIFVLLKSAADAGLLSVLFFIAVISLSLAIMNFLPIPALDGGRLFVTVLYRAIKRPLSAKTEERIHGTAFVALIGLFILITVVDVKRFF